MKEIEEKIKNCRACELHLYRKNAVPGEGNYKAKIMLVGLGPGKDEDLQGRPFVGKAGKFLDKLLEMVGIKREDVFITNIVKCIPPNNMPTENSIKTCTDFYLKKQIEFINPKIIIALGEIAVKYFVENFLNVKYTNMSDLHGKVFNINNLRFKFKLICMFHPASALYNAELKEVIEKDWMNIKQYLC
ncbi:MAG: uracil-DNA glycosylase, partial [Candidatus Aenigmarchaeota archaeon]|nr:uracil-DNA glycosylase [Candidatus Aenigmarchaeota archaeon]MDW8149808.1 uracil-DNA glycosylase [Candidatus Aenigmarchaeota archaeon]